MTDVLQPPPGPGSAQPTPEAPPGVQTAALAPRVPTPSRMTFDEFMAWDHEGIRAEWVDGAVVIVSPVRLDHLRISQFLYCLVADFVRRHDLGEVFVAPILMHLPSRPSGREPDLLFVAAAHADRLLEYEAAQIPEYWFLDPLRQETAFQVLGEDGRYHAAPVDADGFYRSHVVEGFKLRPEWLWRKPLPKPEDVLPEILR